MADCIEDPRPIVHTVSYLPEAVMLVAFRMMICKTRYQKRGLLYMLHLKDPKTWRPQEDGYLRVQYSSCSSLTFLHQYPYLPTAGTTVTMIFTLPTALLGLSSLSFAVPTDGNRPVEPTDWISEPLHEAPVSSMKIRRCLLPLTKIFGYWESFRSCPTFPM